MLNAMALEVGLYLISLRMIANPDLIALETVWIAAALAAAEMEVALAMLSLGYRLENNQDPGAVDPRWFAYSVC